MRKNLLHIHGFNSSPLSMKAVLTKNYLSKHHPDIKFFCPQLKSTPLDAINQLESIIEQQPEQSWYFIGSSLGGYFSTYFSEKYQRPACLVNPAVRPYELLEEVMGKQVNPYTNEEFWVKPSFLSDLKSLEQQKISKNRYQVMVQTGDEVLDYRQALDKYQGCEVIVQQGGDHSFIDYEKMLPQISKYFGWS